MLVGSKKIKSGLVLCVSNIFCTYKPKGYEWVEEKELFLIKLLCYRWHDVVTSVDDSLIWLEKLLKLVF